jgi:hypothetical protein
MLQPQGNELLALKRMALRLNYFISFDILKQ